MARNRYPGLVYPDVQALIANAVEVPGFLEAVRADLAEFYSEDGEGTRRERENTRNVAALMHQVVGNEIP